MIALRKPLSYHIAIALAALTHSGTSHAANDWDCVTTTEQGWSCSAADTSSKPAQSSRTPVTAATAAAPIVIPKEAHQASSATPNAQPVAARPEEQGQVPALVRAKNLDWVEVPDPENCCKGKYQAPALPVYGDENDENPPVYFEAGRTEATLGGIAKHRDGVHLRKGVQHLAAASSDVDQATESAHFEGEVTYREPGAVIVSKTADFDLANDNAVFHDAAFAMHNEHIRGEAEKIKRNADATITLIDGEYTYCPPGHEDWMIKASSIDLDNESGWGLAKHARLNIGPVPVFYAPFFTFPVDDRRMSGFLYPTASFTDNNGWDMNQPYYFNLAENYDDTLTIRNISERGVMLENEFRHLGKRFETTLSAAYMPDDKKSDDARWLASVKQHGSPTQNTTSSINYSLVSDREYFDDLGSSLSVERQSHIDQQASITYHGNNWALSGELHGFQTITADEKPYEKLPQIRLTGSQPIGEHSNLGYTAEYTYFTRDNESFTGSARVTGSRVHLAPALSYNYSRVWGYAKPQAKLWATHYELDDQVAGLDDAPSYSVPVLSFDSGLYFDRDLASGGVHSLEPRLFALYVPDVSQTEAPDFDTSAFDLTYDALFRDNRFSGKDRIGDAQQISLGVTNRFFRANGTEQAYISLGQAYYFDNFTTDVAGTQVSTASSSDIAMQSAWFYSDKTRLTLDNLFARSNGKAISSAFKVSHADGYDKQASLQYLYAENDHDQADLQFIWPLSQKWATIGRWHYDLESNENIERLVGLEYESCCWRVQTFVRDWLEDDDQFNQGVFLRFVLKGLGSIGTASEFLDDVKGFTKREERNEY